MTFLKKIDEVYKILLQLEREKAKGISAGEIADILKADRSNISRYLNALYRDKRLEKIDGRPVLYKSINNNSAIKNEKISSKQNRNSLEKMVGATQSLALSIQKAKAAIMYPPQGLHTLILGETGVGKSIGYRLKGRKCFLHI